MSLDLLRLEDSALLVIDMQNAFCHPEGTLGISGVDTGPLYRTVERIEPLVRRCQAAGMPVLWTVQEHFQADRRRQQKRLPSHTARRKAVSALTGSWDAELVAELAPLASDPSLIIRKHRFGAFYQTRLEVVLDMLGVRTLFVAGVTANACVETTLREAYLRDYDVVAVTDCIAGVNPEWERVARQVWAQYFCILAESGQVVQWIDGQAKARRAPASAG